MDEAVREHLEGIAEQVDRDLRGKYERGQEEHGGYLWQKPGMMKALRDEHIDGLVYYYTLRQQLREVIVLIDNKAVEEARELLVGIVESDMEDKR